ncbi:MAG: hypothetical protein ABIP49_05445, partial [Lysobacterales bacterium]
MTLPLPRALGAMIGQGAKREHLFRAQPRTQPLAQLRPRQRLRRIRREQIGSNRHEWRQFLRTQTQTAHGCWRTGLRQAALRNFEQQPRI